MSAPLPALPFSKSSVASATGERRSRFRQVDVFGAERYRGNALVVVIDGDSAQAVG